MEGGVRCMLQPPPIRGVEQNFLKGGGSFYLKFSHKRSSLQCFCDILREVRKDDRLIRNAANSQNLRCNNLNVTMCASFELLFFFF
jgi:hypothetical protein